MSSAPHHLVTLGVGAALAAACLWGLRVHRRRRATRCSRVAAGKIEREMAAFDTAMAAAQLCARGYWVVDGFLGAAVAAAVRDNIGMLDAAGHLRLGKLQHGTRQSTNQETRSDRIAFLPSAQSKANAKGTVPVPEGSVLHEYIRAVDELRARLSSQQRLTELVGGSLDDCNFMCAIYPGAGARYVKHRDALPYKAGRKLTVIYYLNQGWAPGHGGELAIWPSDAPDGPPERVEPRADRLVLFVSSLEHEVLPAWRPRFALTTWMFNRRDTALELLAEDMRQRKSAGKMDTRALLAALDADSSDDDDANVGANHGADRTAAPRTDEEEEDEGAEVDKATAMAVMLQLLRKKQERAAAA